MGAVTTEICHLTYTTISILDLYDSLSRNIDSIFIFKFSHIVYCIPHCGFFLVAVMLKYSDTCRNLIHPRS